MVTETYRWHYETMKGRIKRKGGVVRVKRVSNMLYGCCCKNYYYIYHL